jgi:hypothetical protein
MGNGHKKRHYHANAGEHNMKSQRQRHLRTGGDKIIHKTLIFATAKVQSKRWGWLCLFKSYLVNITFFNRLQKAAFY